MTKFEKLVEEYDKYLKQIYYLEFWEDISKKRFLELTSERLRRLEKIKQYCFTKSEKLQYELLLINLKYDEQFLNAKEDAEAIINITDKYDEEKKPTEQSLENARNAENSRKALREKLRSQPDSKESIHRLYKVINKPLSSFLMKNPPEYLMTEKGKRIREILNVPGIKFRQVISKPGVKIANSTLDGKNFIETFTGSIDPNFWGSSKEKREIDGIVVESKIDPKYDGQLIEGLPEIPKDKPVLFLSTHNFPAEVNAVLAAAGRIGPVLFGSVDQIQQYPVLNGLFLISGIDHVDRLDDYSRIASKDRMEISLKHGSCYYKYPEGAISHSENLIVQHLFPGNGKQIKNLEKLQKDVAIIGVSTFRKYGDDINYLAFSRPLDLTMFNESEIPIVLRDFLGSMTLKQMEKHDVTLKRDNLGPDPRMNYLRQRAKILESQALWVKRAFEEETNSVYHPKYYLAKEKGKNVEKPIINPEDVYDLSQYAMWERALKKYIDESLLHEKNNLPEECDKKPNNSVIEQLKKLREFYILASTSYDIHADAKTYDIATHFNKYVNNEKDSSVIFPWDDSEEDYSKTVEKIK